MEAVLPQVSLGLTDKLGRQLGCNGKRSDRLIFSDRRRRDAIATSEQKRPGQARPNENHSGPEHRNRDTPTTAQRTDPNRHAQTRRPQPSKPRSKREPQEPSHQDQTGISPHRTTNPPLTRAGTNSRTSDRSNETTTETRSRHSDTSQRNDRPRQPQPLISHRLTKFLDLPANPCHTPEGRKKKPAPAPRCQPSISPANSLRRTRRDLRNIQPEAAGGGVDRAA